MEDNNIVKDRVIAKIAMSQFRNENIVENSSKRFLNNKIGLVACFFIILTTGVVFSKDIEECIKGFFTNSNEAIEKAVEEGFVQEEEMNFVYSNNIGVKLNSLILDNLNLNISFMFETELEDIKSIRFNNFTLKDEKNRVIYRSEFKYEENIDDVPIYSSFCWKQLPVKIDEKNFVDSMLIGLRPENSEINEIFFDIKSIDITYLDGRQENINGNWKFDVHISDEMKNFENINFEVKNENEYIESATATLSPTGMIIKMNLKNILKRSFQDTLYMYVLNCNGKEYTPERIERSEEYIELRYSDIGIYMEEYNEFELYIEYYDTKLLFSQ